MARRPKKGAAPEEGQVRRRRTGPLWIALIAIALVIVAFPTVLVVFIGMLPTIVAFLIDRTDQKYATFCVGGLNFTGVFPYLLDLWAGSHTAMGAIEVLTNVFSLAVMYASAAIGWVVFAAIPPVIATFLTVISHRKISTLRATQKKIVEEWGEEVANPEG